MKKSCLKPQWFRHVASPYGPSTKFIQFMSLGLKMSPHIKLTFSEYGHVAHQIKGNAAYNKILANIFLLHLPLIPGWGQNVNLFFFLEVVA